MTDFPDLPAFLDRRRPGADVNSNRLVALAADIKAEHSRQLVDVRAIGDRAIAIGNMLIEAKATVSHGGWLPWLAGTGLGERTAQRYMRLVTHGIKSDTVSDMGINRVLATISTAPIDFDMPSHGEVLWLTTGHPIERVAWIWPVQNIDVYDGFYWFLMCDWRPGTGDLGCKIWLKRPAKPLAISIAMQNEGFPAGDAEASISTTADTTWLENILFGRGFS